MKEPRTSFGYGRLSGYPICCIITFFIRRWLFDFKLTSWFMNWRWERGKARRLKEPWQHICCPFHWLLWKIGWYYPVYKTCKECGWTQLGRRKGCRVEIAHQDWVFDNIVEYYKRQLDYNGRITMLLPGKMAKRIANEMKRNRQRKGW